MIRRPPRSTRSRSSAASDVYKRQAGDTVELRQRHAGLQRDLLDREARQIPVGLLRVLQHGDEAGAVLVVVVEHRLQRLEVDVGLRGDARLGDCLLYTSPSPR